MFTDTNGDGTQNGAETGAAGVTVQLLNAAGTSVIATTTTGAGGSYSFAGLQPGVYGTKVLAPVGQVLEGTGVSAPVTVASGGAGSAAAVAVYVPGTVTAEVWRDSNADGLLNNGEAGLAGVTVKLLNATGTSVIATTTTNAGGLYTFPGLTVGVGYEVGVVAPSGELFSAQGVSGGTNSAVNASTGVTSAFTLTSGQTLTSLNAGLTTTICTIGDFVWLDNNGNGIQDSGEAGVAGATVSLLGADTLVLLVAETAYKGDAQFTVTVNGVQIGGTYTATASHAAGASTQLVLNGSFGNNPSVVIGYTNPLSDSGGTRALYIEDILYNSVDTGLSHKLSTGTPYAFAVTAAGGGSVLATTTTDATGHYSFNNLAAGVYDVKFGLPTGYAFTSQGAGANTAIDSNAAPSTGLTPYITLTAGQVNNSVDAGVYVPAVIAGSTFVDTNNDGIKNAADTYVGGFTVNLWDATGTSLLATTVSNNGFYSFSGLAPGVYQESFTPSAGYVRGVQGATNFNTSGLATANQATGFTAPITVTSGQTQQNVNEGFYKPASITGSTFLDLNRDGLINAGETTLGGATVNLWNAAGTSVLATTTTSAAGTYSFAGLAPGSFQVSFVTPAGDIFTTQAVGFGATGSSANVTTGFTPLITLTSGQTQANVSAGFQIAPAAAPAPASLGDFVWLDNNGNGIQDSGEAGVAGATVSLLTDTLVLKISEDAYLGDALYTVSVNGAQVGGTYTATALHSAGQSNTLTLNGIWGATPWVTVTFLNDAGFSGLTDRNLYVDGITYNGTNQNKSWSQLWTGGTSAALSGSAEPAIATATTNASGYYTFTGLNPGAYQVKFAAPAGTVFTTVNAGGNTAVDSNANQSTGITAPVTLTAGQAQTSIDAGVYAQAAIGGATFIDNNGNGAFDSGENLLGFGAVAVNLWNATGTSLVASAQYSSGTYGWSNLAPGVYEVSFSQPAGYVRTVQGATGVTSGSYSIDNPATGFTAPITVTSGQSVLNVNAGFYQPATITGQTWLDLNRTGTLVDANGDTIPDGGDSYLDGVTVKLWNAAGTSVIATTTTANFGRYSFSNLAPGTYEVSFVTPAGDVLTTQGTPFQALSSSANVTTGFTPLVTVTSGQTKSYVSAGFQLAPAAAPVPASLGDFVWLDNNGNGIQDTGEAGVAGATVSLLSDTLVLKVSEDAYGGDAQYTVCVNGVQVGGTYTATALHAAGQSNTLTLNGIWGGTPTVTVNFLNDAYAGTAATDRNLYVDGITYNGTNQSKSWSQFTAGGTSAALSGSAGPAVATATTNASGYYTFTGLNPGAYQVKFAAPVGNVFTALNAGANGAVDSNANQSTGITAPVTLTAGQAQTGIDAGVYAPVSISSYVFFDSNNNGIADGTDYFVSGVTVDLWNSTGTSLIAATTTNAGGLYTFSNLAPGTYEVSAVLPAGDTFAPYRATTAGNNINNTSAVNASTGFTPAFSITSGQANYNVLNIGLQAAKCSITGITFADNNHDGIGNSGDYWLPGVTVNLWNATGTSLIATTVSAYNAAGQSAYAFSGLVAGTYEVSFVAPSGLAFTYGTLGNYGGTFSNGDTFTGFTSPITLTAGQTQSNVEEGFVCASTVTGYAFQDLNRNGVYNIPEAYISGVTVSLWNGAGTSLIATTTTNASGSYTFANLANGSYSVQIAALSGQTLTAQGIGGNPAVDSDFNPTTGFTSAFTLTGVQTVQENAGYLYNAAAISSFVFYDFNGNGISDDPNNMAAGITVNLWNGTGTSLIATTTTSSGGLYAFNGLNPGSYEISVVLPGGYTFDPYRATTAGANATNVSNINPSTGFSPAFTLTAGQNFYNLENVGLKSAGTSTTSLKVLKIPSATVINQCGQVTYTFTVTNTGTTALTNVCIVDNIGSANKPTFVKPTLVTTGTNGTLAAGATWTYTETFNQINSTDVNCGTVTHTCSGNFLTHGNTAWLSTAFNPTSCANGATYKFQGVSCLISGGGVSSPFRVDCGDSVVMFSSGCTTATTVWNAGQNCWVTTLPANCNPGKVFLAGCPTTVPYGCNLKNGICTWTIADASNNCGASTLNWSASACGYSTFNANNCNGLKDFNNIGVKSCDNLGGSLACGAPVTQHIINNCGKSFYNCDDNSGSASQNCGPASSGSPLALGAADTVTVTATTTTGGQATASDTKEVIVLGAGSNVKVGGTVPTGVLTTLYGTPKTLEFCYNPGNSVSSGASGAVTGTNSLSSAYMTIQNAAGTVTYFQGAVTAGENIYADAALNPLTNTPTGQTFPSTDANTAIFAKIYASQAAFLAGTGPVQIDGYSGVNGTMHIGDTIGSVKLVGYVGSTGGYLV